MWPFEKKQIEHVAKETKKRGGFFSSAMFSRRPLPPSFGELAARSIQAPLAQVSGGYAMDESIEAVKSTYALNQAGLSEALFGWYAVQGFIGWQTAAIIAQHWLVDKACTMPARDAVRVGWESTVNDGSDIDADVLSVMSRYDKKYNLHKNLVEFVRMGRVFGIRIAMFKVNSPDPLYYEKPFNPDGVLPWSYKGIAQIDPYWVAPELSIQAASDPSSIDFYEPTWWLINGKRVHKSHLIIYRPYDVPDILKPSYLYGGIPLPQKIAERVYGAERTANEAPQLAMTKRLINLSVDVEKAISNQAEFEERMSTWTQYRDNFGIMVTGEDESLTQQDTALSELDSVIMTQYQLVAAIAEVPATELLGTTPKGFNATGEYEAQSYRKTLESIQYNDLSPLIERHNLLVIRSFILPNKNLPIDLPFETDVVWNELDSPTEKEAAETQNLKSQTAVNYSSIGAIDGSDIRKHLIADPESGYSGMADEPEDEPDGLEAGENGETSAAY